MAGRHDHVVRALLDRHGRTYARDVGIRFADQPAPLFQHLVLSLLLSARIKGDIAIAAARALNDAGWTTPRKMADATWADRVQVLNTSGYARYDERTSRMLGYTCDLLLDEYRGDLRRLRERADGDVGAIRTALKRFSGIGDVGADIYLREVQAVWDEVHPFLDGRAAKGAEQLGLPTSAKGLAELVPAADYPRLVCACVRTTFAKDAGELRSVS